MKLYFFTFCMPEKLVIMWMILLVLLKMWDVLWFNSTTAEVTFGYLTGWMWENNSLWCCLLSGNLFTCNHSICFLLSNKLASLQVGAFQWWCLALEATFLLSQCKDQCFYLLTLIFLKIISAALFPDTLSAILKFTCTVFFTKLHIFHTILLWIVTININKHSDQLPWD